jgi:hypothetical protein
MRAWLFLLAACSHTAAGPPPAAPVTAQAPQSTAPARPQPAQTLARVGVEHGSWTDVRIDGTDAAAQELCERVVAQEIVRAHPVQVRALRGCATEPLPHGVASAVQLVALEQVNAENVMLGDLLTGVKHQHDLTGTGTLQRVFPLDTRQRCDAMLAEMEGEDWRREAEIRTQEARFIDDEAKQTADREQTACGELATQQADCAKQPADDRRVCQLALDEQRRKCDMAKLIRKTLEARRASPKPVPHLQRSCRVP